jgi:hypothetical protein
MSGGPIVSFHAKFSQDFTFALLAPLLKEIFKEAYHAVLQVRPPGGVQPPGLVAAVV